MSTGGMSLSKEFFELLKAIGESKSKQEEDRIIMREVQRLKSKMETPASTPGSAAAPNTLLTSKKRAKEFLVRLLYVEMLGHDASWGMIKAVEMAASASLFHKRTGYLVCGACLPPDHEFRFMLVNQMQRDLSSPNVLECSGGLLAATNIITADMVPAVAEKVTKLLSHESATIRKKAIICLHRFCQLAPEVVTREEMQSQLRKVLCDKDPSVMGSSLNVIHVMAKTHPLPFKDLVPSLVSILKQIGEGRLPSEFDYHRVPAPWIQLNLIRILGILGKADAATSAGMYEIVHETMRKADTGINAGYAIAYECIKCIVTIYPNPNLLDAAAETISRFIQSRSHNLKYLGVTGLAMIVESHPQYAAQHQLAVMDCLEDPDETLQRKTLDLLYRMTNPVNVEFISEKLVDFLSGTTDLFLKRNLTMRVCSIAERFAPNNAWYIRTITKLFEVSGDMVPQDVAQNLMSLIAEGTGESEEADMLLRQNAVEIYVGLLRDKPVGSLPRILLETMAWCLGEYGYLSAVSSLDQVLQQLCDLALTHKAKLSTTTRKFLVSAIIKLVAQAGTCPPYAASVIDSYTRSRDVDLQQRCLEFQNLLTNCPNLLPEILPVDASAEDVDVDENLSFLDHYVQDALSKGARPYSKPDDDDDDDDDLGYGGAGGGGAAPGFKMTPYEKPQAPGQAMMAMSAAGRFGGSSSSTPLPPGAAPAGTTATTPSVAQPQQPAGLSLNTRNVANVWGRGGIQEAPAPAPLTAVAPSPSASWDAVAGGATGNNPRPSTAGFGSAPPPQPPSASAAPKTAEQIEKERMAAALFGGIVPGAAPPPPPPAPAPAIPAAPPVAAAPAPAPPAPVADVDLLDMGAWDAPAPAATAPAPPPDDFSPAAAAPVQEHSPAGLVETVSEDEDEMAATGAVQVATETVAAAPPPPEPAPDVDPFAGAGLLGDVQDKPLTFMTQTVASKFEYKGTPMAPLAIATAQFGQQWGSCPAMSNISVTTTKVASLSAFMDLCANVGAHKVEAITATNEGICAGQVQSKFVILLHGKVTIVAPPSQAKIDVTIKSTDQNVCGALAMYLQTQMR